MTKQNFLSTMAGRASVLVLVSMLIAACGGTPAVQNTPATTSVTAAPSAAQSSVAASLAPSPAATTAAESSVSSAAETTATTGAAQGTTIGEKLDLANLSPDVPEPAAPVTISFASWVGESETMQALAEKFKEIHPNITIDFQDTPAEESKTKLLTQVAGGNPPDVAFMDASSVVDFASRKALVNLDPYIQKSQAVKPDDYVAAFRNSATFNGSMYGLPFDGESTGLFYRTDLFEAAGIAEPPKTWEEFRAAAEKLTDPDKKQYGFILFAPEAAYYWYPWLWQAGGALLSEDGQQVLFASDEGKRAAEFYVGLKEFAPPDFLNSNSWDGRVAFANGTVGMYVAGAWFAGTLNEEFPDIKGKWATAPLPQGQKCGTTIAGDSLVLFAQGKNHDAAWKWIEFLSAPENMALWNLGTPEEPGSLLPPRTSLLEHPQAFANNPVLQGFADQMKCGVTNTAVNPKWGEVETALNDNLGKAIYGEIDAATALEQAAQEGQDILNAP